MRSLNHFSLKHFANSHGADGADAEMLITGDYFLVLAFYYAFRKSILEETAQSINLTAGDLCSSSPYG